MELFSIQCTTCRVRLKVKDESIIGDILACPKCGSMVHVTPPVGWRHGAIAAATGESLVLPAKPSAPPAVPAPAAVTTATAPSITPPALSVPTPAPMPAAVEPAAEVPAEAAMTLEAPVSSRVRADWMLWAGGLGAGILVGATVWLLAPGSASVTGPSTAAPAPREVAAVLNAPTASQPAVAEAPQPSNPASPPVADPDVAVVEPKSDPPPAESSPAEPAAAVAAAPAKYPAPAETPAAVAPPAETREPAIKLEPAASAAAPAPATTTEPAEPYPAEEPAAAPVDAAAKKATEPTGALSETDVRAKMATSLAEVRFAKVPLIQFVQFVGDCTSLRIAVDDAALATANIQRTAPITVHLRDTTAGDALTAVLEPLGLTCVARGATLVVTVAEPAR